MDKSTHLNMIIVSKTNTKPLDTGIRSANTNYSIDNYKLGKLYI